jgi:hypothetical protein
VAEGGKAAFASADFLSSGASDIGFEGSALCFLEAEGAISSSVMVSLKGLNGSSLRFNRTPFFL